jgi:ATP-dependent exoDNAse (exonuclease V) beta subunit
VHKAKGLECPRVFILDPHRMPSKWARQQWMQRQEVNIQYVAVTRAKSELYYIRLDQWTEKKGTKQQGGLFDSEK